MNPNGSPQRLIANALHPAEVSRVVLHEEIRRAIVLVTEDQLGLAIGRRGENVRSAHKLTGWDIEIMTAEEFDEQIEGATRDFAGLRGVSDRLASQLVERGYLSFEDLSVIEPGILKEMGGLTHQQADSIIDQAENAAKDEDRR